MAAARAEREPRPVRSCILVLERLARLGNRVGRRRLAEAS